MRPLTAEEKATADAYASVVTRHMRELHSRAVTKVTDRAFRFAKERKVLTDELEGIARKAESDAASAAAGSGPVDLATVERRQVEVDVRVAALQTLVAELEGVPAATAELNRITRSYMRF